MNLHSIFDLTGRKALVTGASSGLGRHFALTLARAGASVAVAARRVDRLSELVAEIGAAGGKALAVAMDVCDRASVCRALDEIENGLGGIDVLVNNAGVSITHRALDYTDEEWDQIVGTNLKGAWIVAQETARRMAAAKKPGSIINISSILGSGITGGLTPYIASKAGLSHLTRALALELARYQIRINTIAPGYVSTEMNEKELASEAGDKLRARIPMRRFGVASDLDGALLLLASDAGRYMSGSEIVVDGGNLCSGL